MKNPNRLNILAIHEDQSCFSSFEKMLQRSGLVISNLWSASIDCDHSVYRSDHVIHVVLILVNDESNKHKVFQHIHLFERTIPLIVISKSYNREFASECIGNGAEDFIVHQYFSPECLHHLILNSIIRCRRTACLRNSNERYNLVSNATNDMVWDWEPLENKIYRNAQGWSKVFGYPAGDDLNEIDTWRKYIHADDYKEVYEKLNNIMNDPKISNFEMEYRVNGKNNEVLDVIDRGYVLRNHKGDVVRIIGSTKNITWKKSANKEVQRLSMIVKETVNTIIVLDAKGKIEWANNAFEKIHGYTLEEAIGKYLSEILHGEGTDPVAERYMQQKIKAAKSFKCDVLGYAKNKQTHWLRIEGQPHFDEHENLLNYFVSAVDISKEKSAEQQLLNNQSRFKALLENSTDGLTIVNANGEVLETSDAGLRILQYKRSEISMLSLDLIHPEDWPKVERSFRAILKDSTAIEVIETRFLNGLGQYTWVESSFHNLLNVPTVNALIIHFRDITERKTAEERIRNSEQKYRSLFQNNPSAMLVCDPVNFQILEANYAAIETYGYSNHEFQRLNLSHLNRGAYKKELKEIAANPLDIKSATEIIWRQVTKAGSICMMSVKFHSVEYFGKRATMVIANNITEKIILQSKLEEEKKQKLNEITAAVITAQEQERRELGSELHDNINQILVTTRLYLEHARQNEDQRMELIDTSKEFIMTAIAEIRKLSKALILPSLGEKGLVPAVKELINNFKVLDKYQMHLSVRGFEENKISNELKLTAYRIIQEQVNNVIKHAGASDIWIYILKSKNELCVRIKDNGKGFNINDNRQGVGLKNINSRAELHNGIMQIDSSPGNGCDLSVNFNIACTVNSFQLNDKAA